MRTREIDAIFKRGRKKFVTLSERQLALVLKRYAVKVLRVAVSRYMWRGGKNLTGNTITGFSAGIYIRGKCVEIINVLDIDKRLKEPTSGYTKEGKYGFEDYDSDEEITKDTPVKPYHGGMGFQYTNGNLGRYSINDTKKWLNEKKVRKDRICIVVANTSPYVEWLYEVRGFDILESVSEEGFVKRGIMNEVERIRPLDAFERKINI